MTQENNKPKIQSMTTDDIRDAIVNAYFDGVQPTGEDKHALTFLLETAIWNFEELKNNDF